MVKNIFCTMHYADEQLSCRFVRVIYVLLCFLGGTVSKFKTFYVQENILDINVESIAFKIQTSQLYTFVIKWAE